MYYSQSSLKVFKKNPELFKKIYLDKNYLDMENENSESLRLGSDFHILAERYFNGINSFFYVKDEKLLEWLEVLKENFSLEGKIKSEYEIKQDKEGLKILAKYDLLILQEERIKIIDFKTNKNPYEKEKLEDDIQTKVYMYLLGENIVKFSKKLKLEDIVMEYFQLNFPKNTIIIHYNEKKHEENKKTLKKLIEKIEIFQKIFKKKNL